MISIHFKFNIKNKNLVKLDIWNKNFPKLGNGHNWIFWVVFLFMLILSKIVLRKTYKFNFCYIPLDKIESNSI